MPLDTFAAMVQRLGVAAIEIRDDLTGVELTDGTKARDVAASANFRGLALRSINALQRFEPYDATRQAEARTLVRYAVESETQALVAWPTCPQRSPRLRLHTGVRSDTPAQ